MIQKIPEWAGCFRKTIAFAGQGSILLLFAVISGCAAYHPLPITTEAVNTRLQPPDMKELRILAGSIRHPILRPVRLNPNEGLTPDGAAVLAVLLNPALRARRDQRALSDAQLLDAGLLPNPELAYSLDIPTGGDTSGKTTAFGLGLNWPIDVLFSRSARIDEANKHKEAVDLDVAWQEWQVAQGAKAAVYQLVSLEYRIALARRAVKRMRRQRLQIQDAVAHGWLTIGALDAAKAAGRRADENLLSLEKEADLQRLRLRRLIGLPTGAPIHLNWGIQLPCQFETPAPTVLFQNLEHRRLDLLALRRGYASREAAVRAATMQQFPKISIGPTISRDSDDLKTTGFGVNIVLPIFNHNQGGIARERATRRQLFDAYVNRVFEARSDIEQIVSGIDYLNAQIAAAHATQTDLATLVDNYRTALADGRIGASALYAAWNDLIGAKTKVLDLEGQLAQTVVALELATGFYEIPVSDLSPHPSTTGPGKEKTP
jgi:outer membrane protein, heavy metal efflux system